MERIRPLAPRTATSPAPGILGDPLAPLEPLAGTIEVVAGPHSDWLPLAGQTVAAVRRRVADRLGLDAEAVASIAGRTVGDDVVLRSGEQVQFVRPSGEKGRARLAGGRP